MAPSNSKLALIIFLTWTTAHCCMIAATRPLDTNPSSLTVRLKLDQTPTGPTCWDSLYQLQSCTGEVIQFFYNGQSSLGSDCCQAVYVIGRNCWPAMLSSLGFTAEETALLLGYCDAQESATHDAPSPTNHN